MKFVFTGDWHLSGYLQDRKEPSTNLSERLFYLKNTLTNMINYCKENEISTVIVGGDLLHNKSIIHTKALTTLLKFFRENQNIEFIVIDGNHDLDGKGEGIDSALLSIDNEPNVIRIGTEKEKHFDSIGGMSILYVPYSSKMVDIIKSNSADILVTHLGLNEGVLNSGASIIADVGLKNLVGKYKYVFVGHYHTPQEIKSEQIEVYYSGSLIQLHWGDKNEDKRFLVFDTKTKETESVLTKGYRKFVELTITQENKDEISKFAKQLKGEEHHVRIRKEDKFDTDDLSNEFVIVDRTEKDITNRGIDTSMTENEIIKKFLEIKEIKDIENYERIGMEIISDSAGKI